MRAVQQQLVVSAPVVDNSSQLNAILKVLEKIASSGTNKEVINTLKLLVNRPVDAYLDLDKMTKKITDKQNQENRIKNLMKGKNI